MVEMAMRIDEKSIRPMGAVSDGARPHRVNCRALARATPSMPNAALARASLEGGSDATVPRTDDPDLRPCQRAAADPGAARRVARDRSWHGAARSRCHHVARTAATATGVGDAERAGGTGAGDAIKRIAASLTVQQSAAAQPVPRRKWWRWR